MATQQPDGHPTKEASDLATRGHIPVLYEEVMAGLHIQPGGRYIDATLGAGGHAVGMLQASTPDGQVLGLDADPAAIAYAREILDPFGARAILQVANFRDLKSAAGSLGFEGVDGILLDLGLSSRQLADARRGFSFSREGPLDMRFNPDHGQSAADLVNSLSEAELADLLWRYGEERHARRIAKAIVAARPVTTTGQLARLVGKAVAQRGRRGQASRPRIDPATRTFQALRIAVNDELDALVRALPQARDLLRPGARLAIITFHSLEDRLVKQFYRQEAQDCICPPEAPVCTCQHRATLRVITRRPIRPTDEEVARNPRSRSAKLRLAERLDLGAADP